MASMSIEESILLRFWDPRADEIRLVVQETLSISGLKDVYCDLRGVNVEEVTFLFQGMELEEKQTINDYDIFCDDVIEVLIEGIPASPIPPAQLQPKTFYVPVFSPASILLMGYPNPVYILPGRMIANLGILTTQKGRWRNVQDDDSGYFEDQCYPIPRAIPIPQVPVAY